jgi:Domain of unknown function (DUF4145)
MPTGPELRGTDVVAMCPECGGRSTFESRLAGTYLGRIERAGTFKYEGRQFGAKAYHLLKCAGCGRGGLVTILYNPATLESFSPLTMEPAPLPKDTPDDIQAEVREAERCAAVGAWRAASAMLRSALEKTLLMNGYDTGKLVHKIDAAAADAVITDARKQRAHAEVRVLGNDVLRDAWRAVTEVEYELSHLYTQRVIEDFYDSRAQVEAVLKGKGRAFTSV